MVCLHKINVLYVINVTHVFMYQGTKFVISTKEGVRKQFIVLNGEAVLAFVANGQKFAECSSYTEVTSKIDCKVLKVTSRTLY